VRKLESSAGMTSIFEEGLRELRSVAQSHERIEQYEDIKSTRIKQQSKDHFKQLRIAES
jgi:hypothetical protein